MAIVGLSLAETWEFSLPEDNENPTVWILGMLDGLLMLRIANTTQHILIEDAVRYGLKGWKNFKDIHGKEIIFKTKKVYTYGEERQALDEDIFKLISARIISTLGTEIIDRQKLSGDERKNSD